MRDQKQLQDRQSLKEMPDISIHLMKMIWILEMIKINPQSEFLMATIQLDLKIQVLEWLTIQNLDKEEWYSLQKLQDLKELHLDQEV